MITKTRAVCSVLFLILVAFAQPAGAQTEGGPLTVTTSADTVDSAPGDGRCADASGECSLRAAVQEANATGGRSVISLPKGSYALTRTGASEDTSATGDLDIVGSVAIRGNGSTLDLGDLGDRGFDVMTGASLDLRGLTIINGAPPEGESGGALQNTGTTNLRYVKATGNRVVGAGASGGAVFNDGGTLTISRSRLIGNTASRAGGAVEANAGMTTIELTAMRDNTTGDAPGNGGAFHLTGAGTVLIDRAFVVGNSAAAEGGGLWNSATGTMTVTRTTVRNNSATGVDADQGGGGIFNDGGTMVITRGAVSFNSATSGSGSGGGIFNNGGDLTMSTTTVALNEAARAGGGIEIVAGTTNIDNAKFRRNAVGNSPGNGGALHLTGAGVVNVSKTGVVNNTAGAEGGGLWNSSTGTMTITGATIMNNSAAGTDPDQGGGGLFNDGGTMVVTRATISNNSALEGSGSGGGILNNAGDLTVRGSAIADNEAARAGGGIETKGGSVDIRYTAMANNRTGAAPGNGGALHISGAATVDLANSTVKFNSAANEGGGLWNSPEGTLTVVRTHVRNNTVDVANQGPNLFQKGPIDGGLFLFWNHPVAEGNNAR